MSNLIEVDNKEWEGLRGHDGAVIHIYSLELFPLFAGKTGRGEGSSGCSVWYYRWSECCWPGKEILKRKGNILFFFCFNRFAFKKWETSTSFSHFLLFKYFWIFINLPVDDLTQAMSSELGQLLSRWANRNSRISYELTMHSLVLLPLHPW